MCHLPVAEAAGCLSAAEAACSAALQLDASSCKARYRRALARHKQVRPACPPANQPAVCIAHARCMCGGCQW